MPYLPIPQSIRTAAYAVWGEDHITDIFPARDDWGQPISGYLVYLTDEDDEHVAHRLDDKGYVRCAHGLCYQLEAEALLAQDAPEADAYCPACDTEGPCPCQLEDGAYDNAQAR